MVFMQTQTPKKSYSPEEYLQLEETSESKNEYRDGEIIPIAGGTTNHNSCEMSSLDSDSCAMVIESIRHQLVIR